MKARDEALYASLAIEIPYVCSCKTRIHFPLNLGLVPRAFPSIFWGKSPGDEVDFPSMLKEPQPLNCKATYCFPDSLVILNEDRILLDD